MKKILAVFAHPDDEAFGPGGTLAKYAAEGVEIHLLCATRGEMGEWSPAARSLRNKEEKIENVRENELLKSAEIIGIKNVEFLDFIDGQLSNSIYHVLADKIIEKIKSFKPQIVLTYERLGLSGHLDHIAVSMITTYAFLKTTVALKLYYLCFLEKWYDESDANYFVYHPKGYKEQEITTRIDFSNYWETKKNAMLQHKSQMNDVTKLLAKYDKRPNIDNFILQDHRLTKLKFPENDLFNGI